MGELLKISAPSTPPTSVDAGGTVLTLATLAAASAYVRSGAALVSGFTGITSFVYVSKSGNDSTGVRNSMALPFLTIAAALTASSAGDTIFLGPGTWTENLTWLEQRSLLGSGSRVSIISGTLTLTAGATSVDNPLNFADVQITGAAALAFNAKSGGAQNLNFSNVFFGNSLTLTRRNSGDNVYLFNCQVASTLTSNFCGAVYPFGFYAVGCIIATFVPSDPGGGKSVFVQSCIIDTLTWTGAGSYLRVLATRITTAFTIADDFGGTVYTTGCDFSGATLTQGAVAWLDQGSILPIGSPAALGANQTDYTGAKGFATVRLSTSGGAGRTIYSLAGQTAGRRLRLMNVDTAQTITLALDDGATGTAAMRFVAITGLISYQLGPNECCDIEYDGTTARWRIIGGTGAFA